MDLYASVVAGEEADKVTRAAVNSIDHLINDLRDNRNSIILGHRLHTLGWSDSFRLLIDGLDACPLVYRNLILNSAHTIYRQCSLAVPLYLVTLQELLKNHKREELTKKLRATIDKQVLHKKRVSSIAAKDVWKKTVHDELTNQILCVLSDAIDSAGALGAIELKRDKSLRVEVDEGVVVSASIHPQFAARVSSFLRLEDCKVVVIDGAVTSVGELNRLLVRANESKLKIAIFASQFSDEVLNTLVVNWQQGKLIVVPAIFNEDLDDINQVRDLASTAGVIPISTDVGNSLSSLDIDEVKEMKGVIFDNIRKQCEIILDTDSLGRVLTLRAELQTKRSKEEVEDIKDVLASRLTKLTSRKTTIYIPCESDEFGLVKDRAASLFTFVKCCANEGVIHTHEIYKDVGASTLPQLPIFLPAYSAHLSILKAITDCEQIHKIGALILVDR